MVGHAKMISEAKILVVSVVPTDENDRKVLIKW